MSIASAKFATGSPDANVPSGTPTPTVNVEAIVGPLEEKLAKANTDITTLRDELATLRSELATLRASLQP